MLKLKDYFTLGNLLAGFACILLVIEKEFDWACYAILIGYFFDAIDGTVARLTRQYNEFGAELDTVCDFITYSIAPSFLIYHTFVYRSPYGMELSMPVGILLAALPFTLGTLRQARNTAYKLSYPCYWFGIPRPGFSLFVVALLRSGMMEDTWSKTSYWVAAVLVVGASAMLLSKLPFVGHHKRKLMGLVRFGVYFFFISTSLAWVVGFFFLDYPRLVFDVLLANLINYIVVTQTQISREDRARMRHFLKTGEVLLPLVHRDHYVRAKGFAVFLEDFEPPDGRKLARPRN